MCSTAAVVVFALSLLFAVVVFIHVAFFFVLYCVFTVKEVMNILTVRTLDQHELI